VQLEKRIVFDTERCKGCELCPPVCPVQIIVIDQETMNSKGFHPAHVPDENQDECISCGLCYRICPDNVMEIYRPKKVKSN